MAMGRTEYPWSMSEMWFGRDASDEVSKNLGQNVVVSVASVASMISMNPKAIVTVT